MLSLRELNFLQPRQVGNARYGVGFVERLLAQMTEPGLLGLLRWR